MWRAFLCPSARRARKARSNGRADSFQRAWRPTHRQKVKKKKVRRCGHRARGGDSGHGARVRRCVRTVITGGGPSFPALLELSSATRSSPTDPEAGVS
jgi:hypothetical protein